MKKMSKTSDEEENTSLKYMQRCKKYDKEVLKALKRINFVFDFQKAVVFCDSFATARCACFDKLSANTDGNIAN